MGLAGIYVRTSIDHENTSIDQQKELGIKFCDANGFQYQIYEDIGRSAYKIDDEKDPFKNLPGLARLLDDIEEKIVDKIWVFEHSRLTRNEISSFSLIRIFEKHKITVYENGRIREMADPQSKMIQGILTQISQYERHLITSRTRRGRRKIINTGHRSYNSIYGYKKDGKDTGGYTIWKPVDSEIENLKYLFQEYLHGKPVLGILKDIFKDLSDLEIKMIHRNFRNALNRFDYTGFSLTTEGTELYEKFKNFEIENLDFLEAQENGKPKYYTNSKNYTVQIVSIADWIEANEKHCKSKLVYKNKKRRTETDIFTGLINCPYCNMPYYLRNESNKGADYLYYAHMPSKKCQQKPKSVRAAKINSLAEVFFFYYYLVFDETKELLEENEKIMNLNLSKLKDKISSVQGENKKLEKQIENLQAVYEESGDKELIKLSLKKETELSLKISANNSMITKYKIELDDLTEEYNRDKMESTYYNVKDLIIEFFEKLNIAEKRAALIRIIKKCQLFGNYLLIDTGKLLFVFDVKKEYKLPESIYADFKNNQYFKENFLNSLFNSDGEFTKDIREFLETPAKEAVNKYSQIDLLEIENRYLVHLITRRLGDININEYRLNNGKEKSLMETKLKNLEIDYSLFNIKRIISLTDDI